MLISLTGKSRHGKNIIKKHGNNWRMVKLEQYVGCLGGKNGMLLQAPNSYMLWVAIDCDKHFNENCCDE